MNANFEIKNKISHNSETSGEVEYYTNVRYKHLIFLYYSYAHVYKIIPVIVPDVYLNTTPCRFQKIFKHF